MRKAIALAAVSVLLCSTSAFAVGPSKGEDKAARKRADHELARQAVLRGEVVPLPRILQLANGYQPGEIIEIELKSRKGNLHYDVHVLTPAGAVRELLIDARTGRLIINQPKAD